MGPKKVMLMENKSYVYRVALTLRRLVWNIGKSGRLTSKRVLTQRHSGDGSLQPFIPDFLWHGTRCQFGFVIPC